MGVALLRVPVGKKAIIVDAPLTFTHREYYWRQGEPAGLYDDGTASYYAEVPVGDSRATLRGSQLVDHSEHAPIIDLDVPARLVPSSTPGHTHLYIDMAMSWRKLRRILRALKRAGVIDREWYRMCAKERQTFARIRQDKGF